MIGKDVNAVLFFDCLKNHFTPIRPVGKDLLILEDNTPYTSWHNFNEHSSLYKSLATVIKLYFLQE